MTTRQEQARKIWQNLTPKQRRTVALGFSKVARSYHWYSMRERLAKASFDELGEMGDEIPDLVKRFNIKVRAKC